MPDLDHSDGDAAAERSGRPEFEAERRVPLPAGRADMLGVRVDHGAQRRLLQVFELRDDERLLIASPGA